MQLKTKLTYLGAFFALIILLTSCDSSKRMNRDFLYFQQGMDSIGNTQFREPLIQPNDLLSIQVFSKSINQEQAEIYNIPNGGTVGGYQVSAAGNIEIPVVGAVKASGLTRKQLAETLEKKLSPYVKDPSVLVKYQQFQIKVLGEVRSPGIKNFNIDRVTILDAISSAGDLTDNGKRQDVMVIREEADGVRKSYQVDLRSSAVFQSPVFQLQQNDIVYVGANEDKLKELKPKKNVAQTIQIALGIISTGIGIFLITKQ